MNVIYHTNKTVKEATETDGKQSGGGEGGGEVYAHKDGREGMGSGTPVDVGYGGRCQQKGRDGERKQHER